MSAVRIVLAKIWSALVRCRYPLIPSPYEQWWFVTEATHQAHDLPEHQAYGPSRGAADRDRESHHANDLHAGGLHGHARLGAEQRVDEPDGFIEIQISGEHCQLL